MRYFQYVEPDDDLSPVTKVFSEEEILKEYYPYWYRKMCEKEGKEYVDSHYIFEDCLDDWRLIHWAKEVED